MEYIKYLIQQIISEYSVPLVFALTNVGDDAQTVTAEMQKALNIPDEFEILPLNPEDFNQIRQLFYNFKNITKIETEE